ncbi:MAG: thioesterase family protein, partial [Deltaproteobacteria bacterium]
TLRTLTATLCGPVLPGTVEITVEALRIGSGTAVYAARAVQAGEVQAHAVAVLGKGRKGVAAGPSWVELAGAADMPDWRTVEPLPPMGALGPVFTQHFEYRPTGPLPYSHPEQARAAGWVRMLEPGATRDAAWVIGSVDAWWPAAISRFDGPRPIATIAFMVEIIDPTEGLDPAAPVFHEAHAMTARDGFVSERRTLRGEDGRLLVINEQTFVIIR